MEFTSIKAGGSRVCGGWRWERKGVCAASVLVNRVICPKVCCTTDNRHRQRKCSHRGRDMRSPCVLMRHGVPPPPPPPPPPPTRFIALMDMDRSVHACGSGHARGPNAPPPARCARPQPRPPHGRPKRPPLRTASAVAWRGARRPSKASRRCPAAASPGRREARAARALRLRARSRA